MTDPKMTTAPPNESQQTAAPCAFDAREMLGDRPAVHIKLDDQTYVLRLTRQGKLILTK